MPTKKMLVAASNAQSRSSDFVLPVVEGGVPNFVGLKSGKPTELAMVVLTGSQVSENELFARAVDAGWKIADVDLTLARLGAFVEMVSLLKIGNIVALEPDPGEHGFTIAVRSKSPPTKANRLP